MARYFYTAAMERESFTYDEYMYQDTHYNFQEGWFDLSALEKTFKGFEHEEYYYDYSCDMDHLATFIWHKFLRFADPEFDEPTKTVSYYESLEKRNKGVRTTSKIGKFLRKAAPYFNDKQIECLGNCILEANKVGNYTHHTSNTPEGFEDVYKMRPESGRNIGKYKCINASCMRDKFGGQKHPCSVYGSGDFTIHYLTNEDGKIAARSIVCDLDNTYAPIYASSKFAGKFLEKILKDLGMNDCDDEYHPWEGAKLLKIKCEDGWVAPYIDVCSSVSEEDDYFVINYSSDEYSFSNTGGYVRRLCKCSQCDCTVSSYDLVVFEGEEYCNGCVNYCDFTQEYTLEDTVRVYYGRGYNEYYNYSETAAQEHAVYNEENDKWYTKEFAEQKHKLWTAKNKEPFKVGDVVRVVNNSNNSHNKVGDIGVISEYSELYNCFRVKVVGRREDANWTVPDDMIHYEFNTGDKVKIVGNCNSHRFNIGDVVTIENDIDWDNDYLCKGNDRHFYVRNTDLEHILTVATE